MRQVNMPPGEGNPYTLPTTVAWPWLTRHLCACMHTQCTHARTHRLALAAAAVAVHRINEDRTILPRDRLEVETVDLLDGGGMMGWGVLNLLNERAADPMKTCWEGDLLGLDRMANITAILGPGYSADVLSVSEYVMPKMPTKDILMMTQGAVSKRSLSCL